MFGLKHRTGIGIFALLLCVSASLVAQGRSDSGDGEASRIYSSRGGISFRVELLLDDLNFPWSLAFLPSEPHDGPATRALVNLRSGSMLLLENIPGPGSAGRPEVRPVTGLPAIQVGGQGGLLDILISPDYPETGMIFFSAARADSGGAGTAVYAARLDESRAELTDLRLLYSLPGTSRAGVHFAGRIALDPQGFLYLGIGDRGEPERAQDLGDGAGKLLRIDPRGERIPHGSAQVLSYGHRNIQGLIFDSLSRSLISHEHGPRGGDEINIHRDKANYGWPLVSYGVNYNGTRVSPNSSLPGIEEPLLYWTPSIAPSGLIRYPLTGVFAPREGEGWSGDLFAGALAGRHLRRVELGSALPQSADFPLNDELSQEVLLEGALGRIRDVRIDAEGYVYLLTDDQAGGLYRLVPAAP